MLPGTIRALTARQRAVMERIDRRIPIKVIALELGVSETRINQHIRALKDIYGAASLFELVDNYRLAEGLLGEDGIGDSVLDEELYPALPANPFSKSAYNKKQIIETYPTLDEWPQDEPGTLVIGDVMPLAEQAPWLSPGELRVVPGLLEGEYAVPMRILAMVFIALAILAAVVLTVTAAVALSNVMDGKADVPMDQWNGPA
jgi:DNA-binding CsgD family transcriptional regulator